MHSTPRFEPSADFVDPRLAPGFQPEHWPQCNDGDSPPVGTTELHERRCLEFLAAFYRINVLHGRWLRVREGSATAAEAARLRAEMDGAMKALEQLEDRYAPIGFFGDPVVDGAFYRNILFVRPELPRILPSMSSASSHVAVPGLEDIPESELQGPVAVRRWSHGKVDL